MENQIKGTHRLELCGRNELKVFGVTDVHSFNDEGIILETSQGMLLVGGSELRITKLNLEEAEVSLRGNIDALNYSDARPLSGKESFFSRILK